MNYQIMRKARKMAKITQDDLGELLGVNRATISRYETGAIEPPATQQLKIAQILNIDLFTLMDDDAIRASFESNERKNSVLGRSGTIVDKDGAVAPIDSYIGQFMQIVKRLDNDCKLDLMMISEYFAEIDRDDQKQLSKFAAFLASNQKYIKPKEVGESEKLTEASKFIREQLLSLMSSGESEPQEE